MSLQLTSLDCFVHDLLTASVQSLYGSLEPRYPSSRCACLVCLNWLSKACVSLDLSCIYLAACELHCANNIGVGYH